jgi:hypothetical protein
LAVRRWSLATAKSHDEMLIGEGKRRTTNDNMQCPIFLDERIQEGRS